MTKIVYSKNAQSFWKQKLYKPNTYSPKKGGNKGEKGMLRYIYGTSI